MKPWLRPLRFAALSAVLSALLSAPAPAAILVKNTNDSGPGSLRDAILLANAASGPETITFAIPGSPPWVIAPRSALPYVTNRVSIQGSKRYEVVLYGRFAGARADGLVLLGQGSEVQSMVIQGFSGGAGIVLDGGGRHKIHHNRIGTDAAGLQEIPNYYGILVVSSDNEIGVSGRNLVSGNDWVGIVVSGDRNQVQGNYVGPNVSGQSFAPYNGIGQRQGVYVANGTRTTITSNLIAGRWYGITLYTTSSNTVVANQICIDADPAWQGGGVAILDSNDNAIGSPVAGGENVISRCGSAGVWVSSGRGNSIRGNRIYDLGGGLPIDLAPLGSGPANDAWDLDSGPNELQNSPRILTAYSDSTTVQVFGELESAPFSSYAIDVYASPIDTRNGSCETPTYLGSTSVATDSRGLAVFFLTSGTTVAGNVYVGATATASTGHADTSEVSPCFRADARFP